MIEEGGAETRLHQNAEPVGWVEGTDGKELQGVEGHLEEQREAQDEGDLLVGALDWEEG